MKNLMKSSSQAAFCAGAMGALPTLALRLEPTGDVAPRGGAVVLIAALRPSFFFRLTTLTQTEVTVMLMAIMVMMVLAALMMPMAPMMTVSTTVLGASQILATHQPTRLTYT